LQDTETFFFLGRNVGYPVALEGALKLKEISYVHAEGYPGGELKHGPLALIEPGVVVVAIITNDELKEKMLSNLAEVKSRGATVVALCHDGDDDVVAVADYVLFVPPTEPLFSPLVDMVSLQQFAYHLAISRGLNVDRPRNLAKTVTVE
jgi:glucosamine--fructose-6-phosphate aminotransferase (isomerizing)